VDPEADPVADPEADPDGRMPEEILVSVSTIYINLDLLAVPVGIMEPPVAEARAATDEAP
jgi:hypothetical protein